MDIYPHRYDVIIGADLTYEVEHVTVLLETIYDLCHTDSVVVIAAGSEVRRRG
jgi:hypothetical protein